MYGAKGFYVIPNFFNSFKKSLSNEVSSSTRKKMTSPLNRYFIKTKIWRKMVRVSGFITINIDEVEIGYHINLIGAPLITVQGRIKLHKIKNDSMERFI